MKEWFIKFLEANWTLVVLLMLFAFLGAAHAFEVHYNRSTAIIGWNENMITGVFTAIIAKLK